MPEHGTLTNGVVAGDRPGQSECCQGRSLAKTWVGRQEIAAMFPWEAELVGAVLGSVGDLCRATSGEGETEPKQIGEGTQDSTGPQDSPET